jgi:hypothetical protein
MSNTTLKIEHPIVDFETWRRAFDRDPVGREASGVRGYRIFRPTDDPKYVLVDLDFDDPARARAFLEKLEVVWSRADLSPGLDRGPGSPGGALPNARARILTEVEARTYRSR